MYSFNITTRYLLIWSIFLLAGTVLSAQNNDFTYQRFGVEDGLPSTKIYCLFKDSRGLLWIGTEDMGLCLFDGTKFKSYPLVTRNHTPSFFDGAISAISEDDLGRLWIASKIGIYIVSLEERTISLLSLSEDSHSKSLGVVSLEKMSNGTIWASTTENKIAIIDSELKIRWIQIEGIVGAEQIIQDRAENIWLTNIKKEEATNIKEEGTIVKVDTNGVILASIKRKLDGNINFLKSPKGDVLVCPKISKQLLILDETNNQLIDYQDPIYQIDKTSIFNFAKKTSDFPFDFLVNNYLFDDNGIIWMGTQKGLFALSAKKQKNAFHIIPELSGKSLRGIHQVNDDLFYISSHGLHEWNRKTKQLTLLFSKIDICSYIPFYNDYILLTTSGYDFFTLNKVTNECSAFRPKIEDSPVYPVQNFATIKDKNGLFRTGGYYLHELDSLVELKNCAGEALLKNEIVFHMLEDHTGLIWMGTNNGLFKIDGCEISHIPLESPVGFYKVNVIFEINDEELLLGTKNQGLFRFHKKKGVTAVFNKQNGLSDNRIATIESNDEKGVWVATFNGLNYLDLSRHQIQNFYENDGLANNEFNSFSSYKLANGDLLFGGIGGCTVVPKKLMLTEPHLPIVHINSYSKINKATQQFEKFFFGSGNQKVILYPEETYIGFGFSYSDLLHQNRANFAYLLEGIDENWIYTKDENTVRYTNLDAGTYYFKTKMKTPSGDWVFSENQIELEVQEYFYESDWFKGFVILLIFSFLYGNLRYRLKQQQRIERIRQKLACDLHDDIGSNLNGIHQVITAIKRQKIPLNTMEFELNKITKLSDDVVNNMNDLIWSIGTEFTTFEDLLTRIQDFADDIFPILGRQYSIECQGIDSDTPINFNTRYHLLMICKEGFTNAIKHSKGGKVDLILQNKNGSFLLQLTNQFNALKTTKISANKGLKSIRQRAKSLNATVEFKQDSTQFSIHLNMKSLH